MKRSIYILTFWIFFFCHGGEKSVGQGGQVYSIHFDSACEMPVCTVKPGYETLVTTIRAGVGIVLEGLQLVGAITLFSDRFGLSDGQITALRNGFTEL
jgi:hypothetical protein